MDLLAKIRFRKSGSNSKGFEIMNGRGSPKREYRSSSLKSIIGHRIHNAGIWKGIYGSTYYDVHWAAKVSIFCFVLTNITQLIELFMNKDDPKALLNCFSVFSFCFMGFLKLCSLLVQQKDWQILVTQATHLEHEELNNRNYKYDYDSDGEEDGSFPEQISSYTKNFSAISKNLLRVYCFTAIVFVASPFIEYGFNMYQGKYILELPHILPGWSPFDMNAFGYTMTVTIEFIAAIYCVTVHIAFDLTTIGLMIFIRGQFNLVHKYSERIGGNGENCDLTQRRDIRAHYRIKRCHHIHVFVLESLNQLDKLIRNILGIYFFIATLTLCSVAVRLQSDQVSAAQIISLVQYLGATLTQLFLFCQYGNEVSMESAVGLGEGPFCAASWCLSPRVRREIALLAVGMARPCRLSAGPFNTLNLPSFIQIVRAAYSYYAVLRQTSI